jgi:hypothetical protein
MDQTQILKALLKLETKDGGSWKVMLRKMQDPLDEHINLGCRVRNQEKPVIHKYTGETRMEVCSCTMRNRHEN